MKEKVEKLISVIMPCFNGGNYVAEGVRSALVQTYGHIEVIVVDDGSTDNSLEVLQSIHSKDNRLKVIVQNNKGAGPARNRGLEESSGEFITFLDADDYWSPDCLEKLHGALLRMDAQIAYCGWQNIGVSGGRGDPYVPPDYSLGSKVEAVLSSCPWPIHAALTRREVIEQAGGFDESLTSCMDYDLWLRVAPFVKVVIVQEVLAFYRHHDGPQITKDKIRLAFNEWQVQRKFLRVHPEAVAEFGRHKIRELTHGKLLKYGYAYYWERDLESARKIFRKVMQTGYGSLNDWKYMLPSLLPVPLHRRLIRMFGKHRQKEDQT